MTLANYNELHTYIDSGSPDCVLIGHHLYWSLDHKGSPDAVEAHCYFVNIGRTGSEQIRSRINNNDCRMFCQLRTKASWLNRPAIIVIDSATYLLTISSPDKGNPGHRTPSVVISLLKYLIQVLDTL